MPVLHLGCRVSYVAYWAIVQGNWILINGRLVKLCCVPAAAATVGHSSGNAVPLNPVFARAYQETSERATMEREWWHTASSCNYVSVRAVRWLTF